MQGKLFQKCSHLLYCSVLSLGGNVNTSLFQHAFKIENLFLIRTPDMVKCYGEKQKSFEL